MKKYIPFVLTIVNILIIALLLLLSSCLLYFNMSSQKEIFSHTALLYQSQNDTQPQDTLLLILTTKKDIEVGNQILYYDGSSPKIDVVSDITDDTFSLKTSDNIIPAASQAIKGVVQFQSAFLGNLLAPLTTQSGLITAIVIIVAGFTILVLSILIIYLKKHRKHIVDDQTDEESDESFSEPIEEETPTEHKTKSISVIEEETTQEIDKEPQAKPQLSGRTPLIASRFPNELRSRSSSVSASRYSERSALEPVTEEIEYDEVKIHEFDTVEELFNYYHTDEIETEKKVTDEEASPQNQDMDVEKAQEESTASTSKIDSLLEQIIKQAEEEYKKEHKGAEITKYL